MKRFILVALLSLSSFAVNAAPKKVSPFSLPQMNHATAGTLYNSADHKDAVFLVEAYFLGCPYCNDNAPNVDDLADQFSKEPRVQVLDVGIDQDEEDYATWIERHHPNHPVLNDGNRALIRQLGTTGYPSSYVLDCHGNVIYKTSGVWNSSKMQKIADTITKTLDIHCGAAN